MSYGRYASSEPSNDGGYNNTHPREKKTSKEYDDECTTLYVTNISPSCSTAALKELFEKFGSIENCRIIHNPITRESRGFGFVSFSNPADAEEAMNSVNGKELERRSLRVEKAKRNKPHDPTPGYYRGPPVRSRNNGYAGSSSRYDSRMKSKTPYYMYHEGSRNGYSSDDERMYSRRRSPRQDFSPRYGHSDRAYDNYYRGDYSSYDGYGDRHRDSYRHRSRSREGDRYERRRTRSRGRHRDYDERSRS